MIRRATLSVVAVLGLAAFAAPVASAAGPTITPLAGTVDFGNLNEGPAGDVCSFDVGLVVTAGSGAREIRFPSPLGSGTTSLLVGPLKATATNLETGESVTVAISGPTFLDTEGFPIRGTGAWLVFEPISEGGMRFLHGRLAFAPVSYGVHAIPLGGTETDLCDRIA
jgi:hypothetical protein